jgi:hypothetical protein
MSQLPGNTDPANKDDLRKLEARMDARFQAVNARFSTVDRRYDGLRGRLDTMESQWQVFGERVEHRLDSMEHRFDAMDHRIDIVFDKVALEIKGTRRSMLIGMASSTATTGFICLGTLAMAT